ncbi:DUF3944 domain-containing protein [Bacteroides fluxus]|uniref:DUF3944 domain-containing protein n=1 Tax=Bacteroides fluxus TaxID=626930 RepID=UPI00235201AB|nr:DUF3944 domain-containing protein [Bacteroides fluxus]
MATNSNLEFLSEVSNEELQVLVDYLTKDKHGNVRMTEGLTLTDEYRSYYPHSLTLMTNSIVNELQLYGGNSFMNWIRGGGVEYREILVDVAKKMKVNFNKKSSVEVIEMNLLQTIFISSLEKMSEAELKELMGELDIRTTGFGKQAMIAAIQVAIKRSGFAAYKIAVIVANAIARILLGRGLTLAVNAAITRWISVFAGPAGWMVTALWTVIDIAGPAYRVTIPAVIQIAYMRILMQTRIQTGACA